MPTLRPPMQFDLLHIGPLVALAHILGVIAACHAILNTRTSQGAIAWAVSLVAMPYLTLVPYLFLGRSKFAGLHGRAPHRKRIAAHARPSSRHGTRRPRPRGLPTAGNLAPRLVHSLTRLGGMPFLPRQFRAHAGERRRDVRGDLRSDRRRAQLCDRAVLHRARRRARRNAQGRADRESAARRARLLSVRQHRQFRSAAPLRGGAARGRRGDAPVRHQSPLRQPLADELPQSPQDRLGGR